MFDEDIGRIERIRLRLFDLKPKDVLQEVYQMYNNYLSEFFDKGIPRQEYFDLVDCPVCGSSNHTEVLKLDNISYSECDTCHSIYTPHMLKDEILMNMYSSGAYQQYYNKLVLSGQGLRKDTLELRKCRQISSFFKKPGRLLDVACGSGSFLKVCQENGWDVAGVDPSDAAVETARQKYNLEIHKGFFENFESAEKFDCITIIGIEHLQDPMGCLRKAHSLLNEGGIVFYEVPSADCLLLNYVKKFPFEVTRYIESGRHYLFFSRDTMRYIGDEIGFAPLHLETNGLDIDTIIFEDLDEVLTEKLLNLQETVNAMLLGDHYRVIMRKVPGNNAGAKN
jgi:SAM-dependent methyltransferase